MRKASAGSGDWGRVIPMLSEEGLLLAEASHRVSNEVSAAMAAMRAARSAGTPEVQAHMVDAAIARLDKFAEHLHALKIPPTAPFDLRRGLEQLCSALCSSSEFSRMTVINLDLTDFVLDGRTARRVMLVACELICNAVRHALDGRAGMLSVKLRGDDKEVRLVVADDGFGFVDNAGTRGTGMGSHLVAELVRRSGGKMRCQTGPEGTTIRVALPLEAAGCWRDTTCQRQPASSCVATVQNSDRFL